MYNKRKEEIKIGKKVVDNMESWQTLTELKEKVYEVTEQEAAEETYCKIGLFFDELINRRRDDPYEGGLQGSGVIQDHQAAFKINERNGEASHPHTMETLAQYLRGDTQFSSEESMGAWSKKGTDPTAYYNLENTDFCVRFLAGSNSLVIIFTTRLDDFSNFQLDVIHHCLDFAKEAIESGNFFYVTVNFSTPNDKILSSREYSVMDAIEKIDSLIQEKRKQK